PANDLLGPARFGQLEVESIEDRLSQRGQVEMSAAFLFQRRGSRNSELLGAAQDVQSHADEGISLATLCPRLGQNTGQLAPADVELVGRLERRGNSGLFFDDVPHPSCDGDRHQRERLSRRRRPHEGEVEAAPRRRVPWISLAPPRARLRCRENHGRGQLLIFFEVELHELPRQLVGGVQLRKTEQVLEAPPSARDQTAARKGDHSASGESAARRFSSSASRWRVFSTTDAGALSTKEGLRTFAWSSSISVFSFSSVLFCLAESATVTFAGRAIPIA